jgi:hypothetical protein
LILEEVSKLVVRLETQTMNGKDETYMITSRINDLTKRLKQVTRKTMSKVSELAMHQAQAMSLYQEKSEKEALLEEAKAQFDSGEIPTEDIEKDFVRAERKRILKENELQKKLKKDIQIMGRFVEM